uniref:Uncharacterized protein n=1 Tax=Arundo donax TaxID=35708 RepID=A0A0A8XUE9_ARUDO
MPPAAACTTASRHEPCSSSPHATARASFSCCRSRHTCSTSCVPSSTAVPAPRHARLHRGRMPPEGMVGAGPWRGEEMRRAPAAAGAPAGSSATGRRSTGTRGTWRRAARRTTGTSATTRSAPSSAASRRRRPGSS